MAARSKQKLKLLYIIDILKKCSDEENPLTASEICSKLSEVGVTAERKAVYDDLQKLIDYGYDIIKTRYPRTGYFLASREFEVPEIYLLSDAVRTAKFISAKKTRELLAKLNGMLSINQARKRKRDIFIDISDKSKNEEIFYNIDSISRAIENGHKIFFKYTVRALNGREIITVVKEKMISPYAMTWQDDHYYLIGNYDKYDNLIHFRIDRMKCVRETDIPIRPLSEVSNYKDVIDVADYTARLFDMFGGNLQEVEFRCSKDIIEQVVDRFTENIFIRNVSDNHFSFTVEITVSDALVTWIINYGDKIKVIKPEVLKKMISDRANSILKIYNE